MKLVSIILPYYKKIDFIKKTIKSILNQKYKNFEIILVNDFNLWLYLKNIYILKTSI